MSQMSQPDKMKVINEAFTRTGEQDSSEGVREHVASWRAWYDALTWFDLNVSPSTMQEAERRFLALQGIYSPPPEPPAAPLPLLGKGQRGVAVKRLKQAIGMVPADGNFDGACEAALKEWQGKHGIEPSGKTGPDTWAALGVQSIRKSERAPSGEAQESAFGADQMQQSYFSLGHPELVHYGTGTVGPGSKGQQVAAWQTIIGVKADGDFGPKTTAATKAWQSAHGLSPDGVVGPQTWAAAAGTVTPAVQAKLSTEIEKDKPFNVDLGNADAPGFTLPAGYSGVQIPVVTGQAPMPVAVPVRPPPAPLPGGLTPPKKVTEASIFGSLGNLSTPAKAALGVAAAAAIVYGVSQDAKKKHGR